MLDAYIIEELKRRERQRERTRDDRRPRVRIPPPEQRAPTDSDGSPGKKTPDSDRGVVIIEP